MRTFCSDINSLLGIAQWLMRSRPQLHSVAECRYWVVHVAIPTVNSTGLAKQQCCADIAIQQVRRSTPVPFASCQTWLRDISDSSCPHAHLWHKDCNTRIARITSVIQGLQGSKPTQEQECTVCLACITAYCICHVCHWLPRCMSLITKMGLQPLLPLQLVSAWAQTWHIISTCRLQSDAQKLLGLDNGNLFRYQFSAIQNHHCPAPASMSTRHQKWRLLTIIQAFLIFAKETCILSATPWVQSETARGSGPIFLHPAAPACESGTTVQLRSSFGHHRPLRRMYQAVLYSLHGLLHAYCLGNQWAVMHLINCEMMVL